MRHFLTLADLTPAEVEGLLAAAQALKADPRPHPPPLAGRILAMIFQKPSLRTRVSYQVGMMHLGGQALYLSPAEVGMGTREPVRDVARVLSRYADAVLARVYRHEDLEELARYSRVPVLNGLSDRFHPSQALADLLTLRERWGGLKGRTLAFIGDGNNVAASLAFACALTGVEFRIATPPGYELPPEVVARAQELAAGTGAELIQTHDPAEAAAGAHALYTDVWVSMGQEEEAIVRRRDFRGYTVDASLLALADPEAIVLHCLPAHRGEEIAEEVLEGPQAAVWDQAENRLHAQKAVLLWLLAPEAVAALARVKEAAL